MSPLSQSFDELDWAAFEPKDRATLLFVRQRGKLLLIRKKRGLGAGKINGPGGRLEPGETYEQAALREIHEELCITVRAAEEAGRLAFQFVDGYSIYATVFTATDFEGTPTETEEAIPLWVDETTLPYSEMWADDYLWMPLMLAGVRFEGRFLFDGDRMLGYSLTTPGTLAHG